MNRIVITYGGRDYSVGNRTLEDVQDEIATGVQSDKAAWIDVNYGAGQPTPCRLLLTRGVAISVVEFPPGQPA